MKIAFSGLVLLALVALAAPLIAPYDPRVQLDIVALANLPPDGRFWFGTDAASRDVFSRVVYGARVSLFVAMVSVAIAVTLGTAVGAVAGFAGGAWDRWLTRLVDALLSIPRILLILVIGAALGNTSVAGLALVLGLTGWPAMSRIVRTRVREVVALDYVTAARALGVRPGVILVRHVLPAVAPQVLVAATLAVATVIPLEAGLSFLGVGVPVPEPSWGSLLRDGYANQFRQWWLGAFPALAIVTTVLCVNVAGERIRDALDPRSRAVL